ncbi:superoxide dismutase family protein [Winogradskyella flava]|uniref:Superoxide dismutase family protein n=1 Tax=Winogradskyella flava TaxID=1884876 RepID=A0A842IYG1_9FLAO|nr:superoxide dismutase family protein [Winogradskyella flava]MBC2845808.1 superoxide dismutase family protein [Winogradskyella flava]
MKNLKLVAIVFVLVLGTSCKNDKKENTETKETEVEEVVKEVSTEKKLMITLSPKSDSNAEGAVTFKEKDGIVSMTANITALSEGEHAIHIHEKADCTSPDGKSSGGHWNPTAQPHGKWGAETGYHKGDIGNFKVGEDGQGIVTITTDEWCIGCGDDTKDILGKAIIVHQGSDDFTSQPSGAAGSRISCGGIIE